MAVDGWYDDNKPCIASFAGLLLRNGTDWDVIQGFIDVVQ